MAEKKSKVIGNDGAEGARQKKIITQWKAFSKLEAYKDLMDYVEAQQEMLLKYAEELQMPHPNGTGKVPIDGEMANLLLQNRRGIGIVKTYIGLRSE